VLSLAPQPPQDWSFVSPEEDLISACLSPPAEAVRAGRAIPLPPGEFDVRHLLERLPPAWEPDVVLVSSSLAQTLERPTPTGLDRLPLPTALRLTDSHHTCRPIRTLLAYARRVGCQYHWSTYDRQHLHFFVEAGLPRVFWVPGTITMPPEPPARVPVREHDVIFCGSVDRAHAYRTRLLATLHERGVDVGLGRRPGEFLPWPAYLERFRTATVVFNCSLNGDFGRRVFEVLLAGGFLLTDRLAPQAGLGRVFQEGVHLECYGSEQELLDKTQHYLAHPDEAAAIARRGQEAVLTHYHPAAVSARFYGIVVDGEPVPSLWAPDDPRDVQGAGGLCSRLELYELLQELHRLNPRLTLLQWRGSATADLADLEDLPRLTVTRAAAPADVPRQGFDLVLLDAPADPAGLAGLVGEAVPRIAPGGLLVVRGPGSRRGRPGGVLGGAGLEPVPLPDWGLETCRVFRSPRGGDAGRPGLRLPGSRRRGLVQRARPLLRRLLRDRSPGGRR
jgi:hypothetical protein